MSAAPVKTSQAETQHPSEQRTHARIPRAVLRKLPILGLLTDSQLEQTMAASRLVQFPKRATVVMKGQALDHLAIMLSGKLQVVDYLADGHQVGLNIIHAGNFFGELAVIDHQPRSASIIALTPSLVLQIPGDVARRLFFELPSVAKAIMVHLAQAIRRGNQLRSLLALPNSQQRVLAILEHMKERAPDGTAHITDMPTHQELAIMANTSRETVSRTLSLLARAGHIEKQGRKLLIKYPNTLPQLAGNARQTLTASEKRPSA